MSSESLDPESVGGWVRLGAVEVNPGSAFVSRAIGGYAVFARERISGKRVPIDLFPSSAAAQKFLQKIRAAAPAAQPGEP